MSSSSFMLLKPQESRVKLLALVTLYYSCDGKTTNDLPHFFCTFLVWKKEFLSFKHMPYAKIAKFLANFGLQSFKPKNPPGNVTH